jgi:hypothetical protein
VSNGYGLKPTLEGDLMLQAIDRPYGIEVQVADPRSSLARFYAARTDMALAPLADLQFRQIGPHTLWIMRKERRAEIKAQGAPVAP